MSAVVTGELLIERPREQVFDFVADERNEPRYNPRLNGVEKLTAGPIGAGTRFAAWTTTMGRSVPMTIALTAYERPSRLGSSTGLAAMDIDGVLDFQSVPEGTLMCWRWELKPHGALKLMGPLIALAGRRQERSIWRRLKRLLEHGAPDREHVTASPAPARR